MTTDTEALRRAFEAFSLDGGLTPGDLEWNGRFYIVPFTQDEWLTFQAGHAAAKAETADVGEPVAFAHFAENGNIRLWAPERPRDLDGNAAQPLYTAEQLAAAVAKERERCALVCEDVRRAVAEINGAGVAAAQQCADAIRAGAKEPSDG